MNTRFNIDIEDIKTFLATLDFDNRVWLGEIIKDNKRMQAQDLSDFAYNPQSLTSIRLQHPKYPNHKGLIKDVVITETSFIFYEQTLDTDDVDATLEYEVEQDLTEQWVKFLLNRYQESYKNYVTKLCKSARQQEVNKAKHEFDKIKEVKAEIIRKLKATLCKLQKLEDLVNSVEEFKK